MIFLFFVKFALRLRAYLTDLSRLSGAAVIRSLDLIALNHIQPFNMIMFQECDHKKRSHAYNNSSHKTISYRNKEASQRTYIVWSFHNSTALKTAYMYHT